MADTEQGPGAGRRWPSERRTYTDSATGATVHRLTGSRSHDHHLYFTNPGWYDDGDRLLFASDRSGAPNLHAVDPGDGTITQLTDLPEAEGGRGLRGFDFPFLFTSLNPERPEAYFWHDGHLRALDLETLALRSLYRMPAGFTPTITNVTADGAYVCSAITEDLTDEFPEDQCWTPWKGRGGAASEDYWSAPPESRIVAAPVDDGGAEVLHAEDAWINHVNTSPTRPELLTFCHEGPWEEVDNRIWGLNRETGEVRRITPSEGAIGHEYWLADGEHIGYHGHDAEGEPFFGVVRFDGSDRFEVSIPDGYTHLHSNTADLVVQDGSRDLPYVLLVPIEDGEAGTIRKLARHQCSFAVQPLHVHARLSPDGETVVYTSDRSGYGNVYCAEVPDLEALPALE